MVLPGVPTNVVAAAGDGQVSVSFEAPVDGGPVVSYVVSGDECVGSGCAGGVGDVVRGSPMVVCGLTNGDEYTFTVAAVNSAGEGVESEASNSVVPAVVLPGVPTNVVAAPGDAQVSVSFEAPVDGGPVVSYVVYATNVTDPAAAGVGDGDVVAVGGGRADQW